jgi:ABC-type antimicrobial peptide transport system permease subunit
VRGAAAAADPSMPVRRVVTLDDMVSTSLAGARFNLLLISSFASVALVVACVGIYGSMSSAVGERRREFGVRIALGASSRTIVSTAMSQAFRVAAAGAGAGLIGVFVIARLLGNALYLVPGQHGGLLYGVRVTDPVAVAVACVALLAVAIAASAVPARQAARVDPLITLRAE